MMRGNPAYFASCSNVPMKGRLYRDLCGMANGMQVGNTCGTDVHTVAAKFYTH